MSSRLSTYACWCTGTHAGRHSDAAVNAMAKPVTKNEPTATGPTEKAARNSDSNSTTPAAVPPKRKSST